MSNPNFELESRAIYKAVNRMSNDYSLQHGVFTYWKDNYSQKELTVVEFSNNALKHFGLSAPDKSSLMIALHAAMTLSLDELPAGPGAMLSPSSQGQAPAAGGAPAAKAETFKAPNSAHWSILTGYMKNAVAEVKKAGTEAVSYTHLTLPTKA